MHLSQDNVLWRVAVWHMCVLMVAHTYVYLKDVVSSLKAFTHQASCNKITWNSEFLRCKLVSKVCTCHVFPKTCPQKTPCKKVKLTSSIIELVLMFLKKKSKKEKKQEILGSSNSQEKTTAERIWWLDPGVDAVSQQMYFHTYFRMPMGQFELSFSQLTDLE